MALPDVESAARVQEDPSHLVDSLMGCEGIPGAPTEPEVIDVDALFGDETEGTTATPATAASAPSTSAAVPPGPGWVPDGVPLATAVRSPASLLPPRYWEGLSFDDLAPSEIDLRVARRALDRLWWLQQEYERLWTGTWWGASDLISLPWSYDMQLHQFRRDVEAGDVTENQPSYLLSLADAGSSS